MRIKHDIIMYLAGRISGTPTPVGTSLELLDTIDPSLLLLPASTSWQLVTKLTDGETELEIDSLSGRNTRFHAGQIRMTSSGAKTATPEFRK